MASDEVLYCICRKPHQNRFMIACDHCDEWYHGDCVGVSNTEGGFIDSYACSRCREKDPSKTTLYSQAPTILIKLNFYGVIFELDGNRKTDTLQMLQKNVETVCKVPVSLQKICFGETVLDGNRILAAYNVKHGCTLQLYKICSAATCTKTATKGSKYCTKFCGLSVARNHLTFLLQQEPPPETPEQADDVADKEDLLEIARLSKDFDTTDEKIEALAEKYENLDKTIADSKSRAMAVRQQKENTKDVIVRNNEGLDLDAFVTCMSCGLEVALKSAMVHMHRCFRRAEISITLAAKRPQQLDGCPIPAFCNHKWADRSISGKTTYSYCRRLHPICPEHGKFSKVSVGSANEICGYSFNLHSGEHEPCLKLNKECSEHSAWAQLERARLATELITQCMYKNYLRDQINSLKSSLCRRHSLLHCQLDAVVCHSEEDAKSIVAHCNELKRKERFRIETESRKRRASVSIREEVQLTGGSLHLPKRHWR
eukprot:m.324408 g.324408  ORF g.324408 m.324408 type:complete len:485 (+) comp16541_c0_seq17:125-1579(+)